MPESAPHDPAAVEQELEALETGVSRMLAELGELRERVTRAENEHTRLTGLLDQSGVELTDPTSLERRLEELTEENFRLKEILREARTRAARIRGRLIVMEDESSG